jgi:hypothetical protein
MNDMASAMADYGAAVLLTRGRGAWPRPAGQPAVWQWRRGAEPTESRDRGPLSRDREVAVGHSKGAGGAAVRGWRTWRGGEALQVCGGVAPWLGRG